MSSLHHMVGFSKRIHQMYGVMKDSCVLENLAFLNPPSLYIYYIQHCLLPFHHAQKFTSYTATCKVSRAI